MKPQRTPLNYWTAQVALLVATMLWAFCDPYFESTLRALNLAPSDAAARCGGLRLAAAYAILALATLTMFRLGIGLFGTSTAFRSVKALMVMATIVGMWCGLAMQLPSIAWRGKQTRLASRIAEFESLAKSLRTDWPAEDGELPHLGPFMAYPFGIPSTLVLLTPPSISKSGTSINTVERLQSGALLFRLTGVEDGDWIEWHPALKQPHSFTGGLGDPHVLHARLPLGDGWYLVRYASFGSLFNSTQITTRADNRLSR